LIIIGEPKLYWSFGEYFSERVIFRSRLKEQKGKIKGIAYMNVLRWEKTFDKLKEYWCGWNPVSSGGQRRGTENEDGDLGRINNPRLLDYLFISVGKIETRTSYILTTELHLLPSFWIFILSIIGRF
jgi:hypothetical protein